MGLRIQAFQIAIPLLKSTVMPSPVQVVLVSLVVLSKPNEAQRRTQTRSAHHTTHTQLLSTPPPQTEAHCCCSPTATHPAPTHPFPHPRVAAESKPQQLLRFPHKLFETELKQPHSHYLLPQRDLLGKRNQLNTNDKVHGHLGSG